MSIPETVNRVCKTCSEGAHRMCNDESCACPGCSFYRHQFDEAHEREKRSRICYSACEGISNEALEAGAVKELIEANRNYFNAKFGNYSLSERAAFEDKVMLALSKLEGK